MTEVRRAERASRASQIFASSSDGHSTGTALDSFLSDMAGEMVTKHVLRMSYTGPSSLYQPTRPQIYPLRSFASPVTCELSLFTDTQIAHRIVDTS